MIERGGIIYVQQDGDVDRRSLDYVLDYFSPDLATSLTNWCSPISANWKLLYETLMEGYHIKSLHRESFYPFGYDNLKVVETFGPHSRVVNPFRRSEQLRGVPPSDRETYWIRDVRLSVLSPQRQHLGALQADTNLVILEPVSPTESQWVIYSLINTSSDRQTNRTEDAKRDAAFVNDSGQEEHRAAAATIQQTLASGANSHLTLGRFWKSHRALFIDNWANTFKTTGADAYHGKV